MTIFNEWVDGNRAMFTLLALPVGGISGGSDNETPNRNIWGKTIFPSFEDRNESPIVYPKICSWVASVASPWFLIRQFSGCLNFPHSCATLFTPQNTYWLQWVKYKAPKYPEIWVQNRKKKKETKQNAINVSIASFLVLPHRCRSVAASTWRWCRENTAYGVCISLIPQKLCR